MTVAFKQENVITEIGPGGVLQSLFSTIAYRLEGGSWGARFPLIMNKLYQGGVEQSDSEKALIEASAIRDGLRSVSPQDVIWDIEDIEADPPWGREVGAHVKNAADYFVTNSGRNLVAELIDNLEALRDYGGTLEIISYHGAPPVL